AVGLVEGRAQRLVARHDRGERALERGEVQLAGEAVRPRQVVGGRAGAQSVHEPELLLGEGERGGRATGETHAVTSAATARASAARSGLPVSPRGISLTSTMCRGTLNADTRSAVNRRRSAGITVAPATSTTAAATSSPSVRCGTPKVTASRTAGWASRISSTSRGA